LSGLFLPSAIQMLNTDKYIDRLQKIGFDEKQAKQVANKMITFSCLIVDNYIANKKASEANKHSETIAKVEQKAIENLIQSA
jgi:hypothetical protein